MEDHTIGGERTTTRFLANCIDHRKEREGFHLNCMGQKWLTTKNVVRTYVHVSWVPSVVCANLLLLGIEQQEHKGDFTTCTAAFTYSFSISLNLLLVLYGGSVFLPWHFCQNWHAKIGRQWNRRSKTFNYINAYLRRSGLDKKLARQLLAASKMTFLRIVYLIIPANLLWSKTCFKTSFRFFWSFLKI